MWIAAVLAGVAAGCASGGGSSSMGYLVTDDGLPGCAFRYGYFPYYDASGSPRMEIVRVERLRFPRALGRADDSRWPERAGGSLGSRVGTGNEGSPVSDRASVAQPPSPPAPRVVAPRS